MSECFIEITITLLNSLSLIFKALLTAINYGGKNAWQTALSGNCI